MSGSSTSRRPVSTTRAPGPRSSRRGPPVAVPLRPVGRRDRRGAARGVAPSAAARAGRPPPPPAPDRSVLDVAVEAGYGSHEAFTRAFQRAYDRRRARCVRTPRPARGRSSSTGRAGSTSTTGRPAAARVTIGERHGPRPTARRPPRGVPHHPDRAGGRPRRAGPGRPHHAVRGGRRRRPDPQTLLNAWSPRRSTGSTPCAAGTGPTRATSRCAGLAARHAARRPDYQAFVAQALADGSLGDTLVDTTCDPPQTHSVGGVVGHVITFAAVRRTLAVGALGRPADFDLADPRPATLRLAGCRRGTKTYGTRWRPTPGRRGRRPR